MHVFKTPPYFRKIFIYGELEVMTSTFTLVSVISRRMDLTSYDFRAHCCCFFEVRLLTESGTKTFPVSFHFWHVWQEASFSSHPKLTHYAKGDIRTISEQNNKNQPLFLNQKLAKFYKHFTNLHNFFWTLEILRFHISKRFNTTSVKSQTLQSPQPPGRGPQSWTRWRCPVHRPWNFWVLQMD